MTDETVRVYGEEARGKFDKVRRSYQSFWEGNENGYNKINRT